MLPAGAGHPARAGPDGSAYPRLPGDPATVVATRIGDDGRSGKDVATEIDQMIDLNQVEGRVRASSVKKIAEIIEKRSEEHTSELQSLMRISYAVFCLKKKKTHKTTKSTRTHKPTKSIRTNTV